MIYRLIGSKTLPDCRENRGWLKLHVATVQYSMFYSL